MVTLLTVVHIVVCLFLILVVLLQAGKGGGMGIAFGGAGSQTVFGSSGAGNFLTRLTSITAAVFLLTSLALAHYSSRQDSKRLQQLASQRAAEKKVDDDKAAKLKAELDKARAAAAAKAPGSDSAAGGAGATAPGVAPVPATLPPPAGTTAPSGALDGKKLELKLGDLGSTSKPAIQVRPLVPAGATPGTKPAAESAKSAPPAGVAAPKRVRVKAPVAPAADGTTAAPTTPAPAAPSE